MLKNMKIGTRLGLGFAALLVLLAGMSGVGIYYMTDLSELTAKLYRYSFTVSGALYRVEQNVLRIRIEVLNLTAAKDNAEIDAIAARMAEYEQKAFQEFDLAEERYLGDKTEMTALRKHFADWNPICEEIFVLMRAGKKQEAFDLTRTGKGGQHVARLFDMTGKAITAAQNRAVAFMDTAEQQKGSAISVFLMLVGVSVLLGVLLSIWLTLGITRPVAEAVQVSNRLAEGDLTTRVEARSSDEVGALMRAMNNMVDNLHEVVGQVMSSAEQMTTGSQQVADASQAVAQGANESAASLEEISSSMEQINAQIQLNADNASQANHLSSDASLQAAEGNEQMKRMAEAMTEITQSSKNISRIIKTIDEIAFQTNLLAINAAVEAARAGAHGKGFAVVAEEVRNLAQRSAEAAKETTAMIEESIQRVEKGASASEVTAESLRKIVDSSGKMTHLVAEIAAASQEQAKGIAEVKRGLDQLNQVTQENAQSSEESAAASEELSAQAHSLKQVISRFKLRHQSYAAASSSSGENAHAGEKQRRAETSRLEHAPHKTGPQRLIHLSDEEYGKY